MVEEEKIPDVVRRDKVLTYLKSIKSYIRTDIDILNRAKQHRELRLKTFDSLHIACAEKALVDYFITTDDGILSIYKRNPEHFTVAIMSPNEWMLKGKHNE